MNYTKTQIKRAGEYLAKNDHDVLNQDYNMSMDILSYYRSCHEHALINAVDLLSECAREVEHSAIIGKRLKRAQSIIEKLKRYSSMKLNTMQDIGGCRAILSTEKKVTKVVRCLKKKSNFRINNYIENPKSDGYRGVHLIGYFQNEQLETRPIEIQVRTVLQHSWATAVEIIDLFTGQALKASRGTDDWKDFFVAASYQLALIEKVKIGKNTTAQQLAKSIFDLIVKEKDSDLKMQYLSNMYKLYKLDKKMSIVEKFEAFTQSIKLANEHIETITDARYTLLTIDTKNKSLNSTLFSRNQFKNAANMYLEAEKKAAISQDIVVALISADSLGGIKEAYPNYFADSSIFIQHIHLSIQIYKNIESSWDRFIRVLRG
jgi:ppGpp synthetase/RelA/SpoT-type nucleotidyltranferase